MKISIKNENFNKKAAKRMHGSSKYLSFRASFKPNADKHLRFCKELPSLHLRYQFLIFLIKSIEIPH